MMINNKKKPNIYQRILKPEKSPAVLIHACRQEKSKSFMILIRHLLELLGSPKINLFLWKWFQK